MHSEMSMKFAICNVSITTRAAKAISCAKWERSAISDPAPRICTVICFKHIYISTYAAFPVMDCYINKYHTFLFHAFPFLVFFLVSRRVGRLFALDFFALSKSSSNRFVLSGLRKTRPVIICTCNAKSVFSHVSLQVHSAFDLYSCKSACAAWLMILIDDINEARGLPHWAWDFYLNIVTYLCSLGKKKCNILLHRARKCTQTKVSVPPNGKVSDGANKEQKRKRFLTSRMRNLCRDKFFFFEPRFFQTPRESGGASYGGERCSPINFSLKICAAHYFSPRGFTPSSVNPSYYPRHYVAIR